MFEYYGFPMSEAMVFGLDGTMGFGFFHFSDRFTGAPLSDLPMFVGGKQDTLTPNSLACRLLGTQLHKQSFTSPERAWDEKELDIIDSSLPLISDSAAKWTEFVTGLKNAAKTYKNDCAERVNLSDVSRKIKNISLIEEELFNNILQIKL
jgi:hypothetical protein